MTINVAKVLSSIRKNKVKKLEIPNPKYKAKRLGASSQSLGVTFQELSKNFAIRWKGLRCVKRNVLIRKSKNKTTVKNILSVNKIITANNAT